MSSEALQEELEEDGAQPEQSQDEDLESSEDDLEEEMELDTVETTALVEALVFAHGEPITVAQIKEAAKLKVADIRDALESLQMKYQLEESGIELKQVGGKYQFRTKTEYGDYVRALKSGRPRKLSPAALETLAIVAYRQPIVKSDVEKIRGVDATPTLKTLLDRRLIKIVGHRDSVGQPALYGTAEEFLKIFGLRSLSELPSLRDLKELEADPGEPEEQHLEAEGDVVEADTDQELDQTESDNVVELPKEVDQESESPDELPIVENA